MKLLTICCLGLALLAGCREDDVIECDLLAPPASFADLRAAAPAVQRYSFNLAQAQSFRTRAGATVAFGPSVFILPNGNVATGQAELRLREIYAVPDMVLANLPTTAAASRQMLISGGEFNIQVWQGGTRLRMSAVSPTGVRNRLSLTSPVPGAGLDTTPMLLWQQPATLTDSTGWQPADTTGRAGQVYVTTSAASATPYYQASFSLDSLSTWNIDQFWHAYQTNPSGSVGIEVPTASAASVTRVYFRPIGYNGLARCYPAPNSTTRWNTLLPYGVEVVAVVLQERDGQLYYGTQRVTTAANQMVTPPLQALSLADIVQRIRQL